jgi:hypothetical protein
MAYAVGAGEFAPDRDTLGRPDRNDGQDTAKEHAADRWSRSVFGADPNKDILRALQVSDSTALSTEPAPLEVCAVRVTLHAQDTPGSPIACEAVSAEVRFECVMSIDELSLQYAAKSQYASRLDWNERQLWLLNLPEIVRRVSERRIEFELLQAEERGLTGSSDFYKQLHAERHRLSDDNAAFLQLGWGTGWEGTSVGPWLPRDLQDDVRERYSLGRPPEQRGKWQPDFDQPFPKSHRLVDGSQRPLGWVKVTFKPEDTPRRTPAQEKLWTTLSTQARAALKALPALEPGPALRPHAAASATSGGATLKWSQPTRPSSEVVLYLRIADIEVDQVFTGQVMAVETEGVFLTLPGLQAEPVLALIVAGEIPEERQFKEDQAVLCRVRAIEPDPKKPDETLVYCQPV